jgi:hypothetical protein
MPSSTATAHLIAGWLGDCGRRGTGWTGLTGYPSDWPGGG